MCQLKWNFNNFNSYRTNQPKINKWRCFFQSNKRAHLFGFFVQIFILKLSPFFSLSAHSRVVVVISFLCFSVSIRYFFSLLFCFISWKLQFHVENWKMVLFSDLVIGWEWEQNKNRSVLAICHTMWREHVSVNRWKKNVTENWNRFQVKFSPHSCITPESAERENTSASGETGFICQRNKWRDRERNTENEVKKTRRCEWIWISSNSFEGEKCCYVCVFCTRNDKFISIDNRVTRKFCVIELTF